MLENIELYPPPMSFAARQEKRDPSSAANNTAQRDHTRGCGMANDSACMVLEEDI